MLYLGIDQHARQITVSLRDENGDVIEARQVSTKPAEELYDLESDPDEVKNLDGRKIRRSLGNASIIGLARMIFATRRTDLHARFLLNELQASRATI